MKVKLRAKLLLYRFFSTSPGRLALKLLSFGVNSKGLNGRKEKKYPFLIAITVDTESGYVDKYGRRLWQKENPNAYQGYYYGIRKLLAIFQRHNIHSTFFLSTNCFSAKGKECQLIKKEISNITKTDNEIGLHLHPDSDLALQKKLSKKFNATSAFFYDYKEKLQIIKAAKRLVMENLGKNAEKNLISFRWGNWALDTEGAMALNELGFKIDSSATPGIKGHTNDIMKYDWSKVKTHYPWMLSIQNYQNTNEKNSKIMEMPIATFSFFGINLRADPVNSVLLNHAFSQYYKKADRSEKPFVFVVLTHSSEATTKDGSQTQALRDLERFIILAKKYADVKFVTLRDAYKMLEK